MACVAFGAFTSRAQSPGDRERDIKEQARNGEENHKSNVSGLEPIDWALPAEPSSRAHGLYWAFPCPPPSWAGFSLPFTQAVTEREFRLSEFFILPGGSGS